MTTTPTPRQVVGDLKAVDITTIEGALLRASTTSARVQCWGNNAYGVIGDGSKPFTTSPEAGPADMREIEGGWRHVCGVTTSGSPYCWGQNDRAQLGNGTLTSSPSPTEVEPLPPADPAGVDRLPDRHRQRAGQRAHPPLRPRRLLRPGHHPDDLDGRPARQQRRSTSWACRRPTPTRSAHLLKAARGTWDVYPRPEAGDDAAEAALAWRTSVWELVEATTMMNQFISKELPRPIVKLRHKVTGKEIYVINVHNAPWDYQFKRNKATNVQIAKINELRATGTPVFYIGDMNEKREILCKVLGKTDLVSPFGGAYDDATGKCTNPPQPDARRLDLRFAGGDVRQLRVHPSAAAQPGHRPQHGAGRRTPPLTGPEVPVPTR